MLFGLTWPILKIGLPAGTPVWLAAGARHPVGDRRPSSCSAALGRLRGRSAPTGRSILSVGGLQLTCFFAFANLGVQSLPAGRSGVLAYTAMLWMVPLSLLVGEKVGWRAFAGVALGVGRHRRAGRPAALRLAQPRRSCWATSGCCWRASPGRSPSLHTRRHRWRSSPLDALPWQMSVATVLLWMLP